MTSDTSFFEKEWNVVNFVSVSELILSLNRNRAYFFTQFCLNMINFQCIRLRLVISKRAFWLNLKKKTVFNVRLDFSQSCQTSEILFSSFRNNAAFETHAFESLSKLKNLCWISACNIFVLNVNLTMELTSIATKFQSHALYVSLFLKKSTNKSSKIKPNSILCFLLCFSKMNNKL